MARFWLILGALALSVSVTVAATAGEAEDLEERIERLRGERDKLDRQAEALFRQAQDKDEEIVRLQKQLRDLRNPKKLAFGTPIVLGPLYAGPPEYEDATEGYWPVVREAEAGILRCYVDQEDSGRLVIKLVVGADGSVTSATKKAGTVLDPRTTRCVTERFMQMKFPAHEEISIISQPLAYEE